MLTLVVRKVLILAFLLAPVGAHAEFYPSTADPCADHHYMDCNPGCSPGQFCVKSPNGKTSCENQVTVFGIPGYDGDDLPGLGSFCWAVVPMRTGPDDREISFNGY